MTRPAPVSETTCPGCGAQTWPPAPGGRLCLSCTEGEIGETYEQVRDRATEAVHRGTKRKWSVTT